MNVTLPPLTLAAALDGANLLWTTGGEAPWVAQTDTTQDGEDAAASGRIDNSQSTWVQTTVTGPGTLFFWWKVSSEYHYDFLQFLYEGYLQDEISGDEDWQQSGWTIPAGTHTLRWQYTKDSSVSEGEDRAWLDQVSFVSTP